MAKVDSVASRARGHNMAPLFIATFVISSGNGVVFPLLADLQDEHGLPTYGLGIISSRHSSPRSWDSSRSPARPTVDGRSSCSSAASS